MLTVLAPCILPLLPVIVGGSLDAGGGGKSMKRAFTVTIALGVSVILFTFLLKASTLFIDIPENFWKYISGGILVVFGLITLFPSLWEKVSFAAALNQRSNMALGKGYQKKSFWGDIIIGASLGPVFSTCSPTYFVVLATVLPVSLVLGFTYILAYVVGLSLALLAIAFVGQKIMGKLGVAADPHGKFKRILGLIFLLVGIAIITGYDKKLEQKVLDSGLFDITKVEQRLLKLNEKAPVAGNDADDAAYLASQTEVEMASSTNPTSAPVTSAKPPASAMPTVLAAILAEKKKQFPRSAEITGVDGYINTDGKPVTIAEYRGKSVVLVDFWTYSCINCQRTLPYVTAWYEKYKGEGLVVIGVHTPEFAFEHLMENVKEATVRHHINYPVVLDNNYATWTAFGNQFWPRKYLVDIDGYIIYDHIGEGEYDVTERAIQKALKERNDRLGTSVSVSSGVTKPSDVIVAGAVSSPETYFGANRNEFLGNGKQGQTGEQYFAEPIETKMNMLYLIGQWNIAGEYAETSATVGSDKVGSDRVNYHYKAGSVYVVAGAKAGVPNGSVTFEVLRDSKPLDASNKGADVFIKDGKSYVTVSGNKLYKIIEDKASAEHFLEFIISDPGLQFFAFTFG